MTGVHAEVGHAASSGLLADEIELALGRRDETGDPDLGCVRSFARRSAVVLPPAAGAPQLAIGLEIEHQPRMTGRHHRVAGVARRVTDMAGGAGLGSYRRTLERRQAAREVIGMRHGRRLMMRRQPLARWTVAGLAGNAVGHLMPRAALRGRYHLGVAGEALRRLLGRTDTETRRHLTATRIQQHTVGARVRIELRPGDILVLQHAVRIERPRRAVTKRGGARRRPFMLGVLRDIGGERRHRQAEQQRLHRSPGQPHPHTLAHHRPPCARACRDGIVGGIDGTSSTNHG